FIKDIVLDVAGILSKSFEAPIPVKKFAPGQDGQKIEQINSVNREGFTNKINVDVDVESMRPQNKDIYRKQLIDALQFLLKFEPIMNKPKIDPETGQMLPGKTLNPHFWLEKIMDTMNIR